MACEGYLASSQESEICARFAELLKPIRELTKQGCWEMNMAGILDQYAHYIKDLHVEEHVDGEQEKVDFAKAAIVVQNSAQIYSKKVDDMYLQLQETVNFLSHGYNVCLIQIYIGICII